MCTFFVYCILEYKQKTRNPVVNAAYNGGAFILVIKSLRHYLNFREKPPGLQDRLRCMM